MARFDQNLQTIGAPSADVAPVSVCERLRKDILAGQFVFGSRLKINELAARYTTSHMPVREALRQLQGEGLVKVEPNCGARVQGVDLAFLCDIFDLRIALEPMLARRAAERMNHASLQGIVRIEESLETCAAAADYAGMLAANRAFHSAINDLAGNHEAIRVLDRHWSIIVALWGQHGYGPERASGVIADHRQIIQALKERDADYAAIVATAHAAKAKHEMLIRFRDAAQLTQAA